MSKLHTYPEDEEEEDFTRHLCNSAPRQWEYEDRLRAMLPRALESIQDLLDEAARYNNCTRMSMQQQEEMENIIKDAIVQGLMQ